MTQPTPTEGLRLFRIPLTTGGPAFCNVCTFCLFCLFCIFCADCEYCIQLIFFLTYKERCIILWVDDLARALIEVSPMYRQVSERQVAANQSNAQKSTGPNTPEAGQPAPRQISVQNPQNGSGERSADRVFQPGALGSQETITKGDGAGSAEEVIGEKMAQKGRTN